MGKATLVLGILLCLFGCSSSGGSGGDTLQGLWQVQLASGCDLTYSFNGSAYSDNVICLLTNGNYGVEIENGTFSTAGSDIDFVPTESSCPADTAAASNAYSLQGNQLVITFGSSQAILEKIMLGTVSGGARIEDGCWDFTQTPATFTPHAIQKL